MQAASADRGSQRGTIKSHSSSELAEIYELIVNNGDIKSKLAFRRIITKLLEENGTTTAYSAIKSFVQYQTENVKNLEIQVENFKHSTSLQGSLGRGDTTIRRLLMDGWERCLSQIMSSYETIDDCYREAMRQLGIHYAKSYLLEQAVSRGKLKEVEEQLELEDAPQPLSTICNYVCILQGEVRSTAILRTEYVAAWHYIGVKRTNVLRDHPCLF